MFFLSRKERVRKQRNKKRKKLLCVALLVATSATVAGFGYSNIAIPSSQVHEDSDTTQSVTDLDIQEDRLIATDRNHIWLNPDKVIEGQEAPEFIALCLHEVSDKPNDNLAISPANFHKLVKELKDKGFQFIDSNDVSAIIKGTMEQPKKAVFLSFDDGYEDNYTNAFPILKEESVKATFFLVSGSIGTNNRMTVAQLKDMAAYGMSFGSHTVNHAELNKLTPEQIQKEMNDSRYVLEHDYKIKVDSLAYPCGFENEDVVEDAEKNYDIAFTASMDENVPMTPHTIHRYGVFRWNNSLTSIIGQ